MFQPSLAIYCSQITPRASPLGALGHAVPLNLSAFLPIDLLLKSFHCSKPGTNVTGYVINFLGEKIRIDLSFLRTLGLFKYFFFLKIYVFFP